MNKFYSTGFNFFVACFNTIGRRKWLVIKLFFLILNIFTGVKSFGQTISGFTLANSNTGTGTTMSANVYYVNDGSTTSDKYTGAIGNNATAVVNDNMHPWASLKTVLGLAGLANGDYIYIDAGTYSDQDITLTKTNLNIIGAVDGTGNSITRFVRGVSSDHYFMQINQNNTIVSNLYLQGYNNSTICGSCGGALTVNATGIEVNNVQTTQNWTSSGTANYAILILANSSVVFNGGGSYCNDKSSTAHAAGGMYFFGTGITATIKNYLFNDNYRGSSGGNLLIDNYAGGGSYTASTTVVNIKNTRFQNMTGSVENMGIALQVAGGTVNMTDCYFDNNYSYSNGTIVAGAVYVSNKAVGFNVSKTVFTNNTGLNAKGVTIGIDATSANIVIDSCYFSGNTSTSALGKDIYIKNALSKSSAYCTFNSSAPQYSGIIPTNMGVYDASTPGPSLPSFSGSCATSVVLPVELISFSSECLVGIVKLSWQTASEKNNDYFEVQKSKNGVDFIAIDQVNGNGNSSVVQNYSFEDVEPNNGATYYRLKQVDYNGEFSYSELVSVKCDEVNNNSVYVYPNPATNEIKVNIGNRPNQEVIGYVVNVLGEQIMSFSNKNMNNSALNLSISELSNGIYNLAIFSVQTGEMIGTSKFIKK